MRSKICAWLLSLSLLFGSGTTLNEYYDFDNLTEEQYEELIEPYSSIAEGYGMEIFIPEENRGDFFREVSLDEFEAAIIPYQDMDVVDCDVITGNNSVSNRIGGLAPMTNYTWVKSASLGSGLYLTAYINGTYNRNRVTSCTSVTSAITGVTVGFSYHQTTYSYNINSTQTQMTVDVYGVLNMNIIVEGIGTVASKNVHRTYTCTPA